MTAASSNDVACDFDVVTLDDVSRYYGRRRALSKANLTCRCSSILGLFGPNGAGKSTILGLLSTIVAPTKGAVRYGTQTATEWGDRLRSRIGVLGHDLFLYGELTARENLEFFGRLHGVPRLRERIDLALGHARLADRGDDRVSAFSRGLRQRLALERALLHEPRLVLLDEPFTGLDDTSSEILVARLRVLREEGAIVVMATHDFDTADGLIDDAWCLSEGWVHPMATGDGRLRERYRRTLAGVPETMSVLGDAWLIARKDLRIESRSREIVYTTLFFALACVLVFSFAFVRDNGQPVDGAAAGILWVAIAFSGTLALGRTFERERQGETLRALLLAPVERSAIYLGKLLGVLVIMAMVDALLIPIVALLFQAPITHAPLLLVGLIVSGTIGFAVVGTLFAAMLVRAQARDVLLPVVLYPLTVPVLIGGVRGTTALFSADPDVAIAQMWLALLIFFDVVFLTLSLWTFAPVMRE